MSVDRVFLHNGESIHYTRHNPCEGAIMDLRGELASRIPQLTTNMCLRYGLLANNSITISSKLFLSV